MISFTDNLIVQGNVSNEIRRYIVVFQTPFGWTPTIEEAIKLCTNKDLDPNMCIQPTAMAQGDTLHELVR